MHVCKPRVTTDRKNPRYSCHCGYFMATCRAAFVLIDFSLGIAISFAATMPRQQGILCDDLVAAFRRLLPRGLSQKWEMVVFMLFLVQQAGLACFWRRYLASTLMFVDSSFPPHEDMRSLLAPYEPFEPANHISDFYELYECHAMLWAAYMLFFGLFS